MRVSIINISQIIKINWVQIIIDQNKGTKIWINRSNVQYIIENPDQMTISLVMNSQNTIDLIFEGNRLYYRNFKQTIEEVFTFRDNLKC